jgi:enhancer of mRNA-decapping protein 4
MLRQQIGQDLSGFVTALQAERESAERERQKQLLTAVSAAITRDLPVQMEKIVSNIVKRELKALAPAVAAEIAKTKGGSGGDSSKEIVKALPGALATAMTGTVVPKFEAATREMFDQVKGAFEKGMDDIAQELYTQKENAIAAEATPLISSLRLASSEVRGAAEALLTMESIPQGGVNGAKAPGPKVQATSLEAIEAQMDPTIELGRLVDEGNFEGAFQKALGMASVEMVTWTCGRCEPARDDIFGSVPVPLSQTVLLSLMQQLSSDLDTDASLKLQWIQAACLAMDPSDASLAQALPVIFGAVFDSLTETARDANTPPAVKGDLRLVLHVVNSLLSSFK